jgi:DNA-binding transcriptional ArsR family regulator
MVQHPLPDDIVELIAQRFQALADPTRIKLLDCIFVRGEATVQELTEVVGSTQQNVSRHLGVLRDAGIVRRQKVGNYAHYSIADERVFALCEDVCGSLEEQYHALHGLVAGARG